MDPVITVAALGLVGTLGTALLYWHAATSNARTERHSAAQQAADNALEEARRATEEERQRLMALRDARLREYAEQIGATRTQLASALAERDEARAERDALEAENQQLRNQRMQRGGTS